MSINFISFRKLFLAYAAWWLFWICLQTFIMHKFGFAWGISLFDSFTSYFLLATAGCGIVNLLRFYQPSLKNGFYLIVWCIGLAGLVNIIFKEIITQSCVLTPEYLRFLQSSLLLRFSFSLLMIAFMALLSWLWYYVQTLHDSEKRKTDAEKLIREAELAKIRQQLQPHFLFNSLNSISALIIARPEEARKMIQQLSDFLRGTLKKDEQELVCLSEELIHLQLYLEIEKVRFGHRLKTIIECNEESLNSKLPPLLLQPVVENAIKFGLYDTVGETIIGITSKAENKNLVITIENPFDASTSQPKQGTGFGLNSVQRRLYLLYARNDLLTIKQNNNIFITQIKIPQLT